MKKFIVYTILAASTSAFAELKSTDLNNQSLDQLKTSNLKVSHTENDPEKEKLLKEMLTQLQDLKESLNQRNEYLEKLSKEQKP